MFEKFTDGARLTMAWANQEAQREGCPWLSAEHVLLGLLRVKSGFALQVLDALHVDVDKLRNDLRSQRGARISEEAVHDRIQASVDAKQVITTAITDAKRLGDSHVGTEHLLLGLLDAEIAGETLRKHDVGRDAVVTQIQRLRESGASGDGLH